MNASWMWTTATTTRHAPTLKDRSLALAMQDGEAAVSLARTSTSVRRAPTHATITQLARTVLDRSHALAMSDIVETEFLALM